MKAWHLQAAAAVAALAGLWYVSRRVGAGISNGALNPASPNNLAYSAVNAIGGELAGTNGRNADGSWTLGGWFYDVTHPGWAEAATAPTPAPVEGNPEAYLYGPPINSSTWGA